MKPSEERLLKILSNHDITFFIPPYQRNYEWDQEQCKVFLDDVIKTSESNNAGGKATHFFGSLTFFEVPTSLTEPDKLILIDGQQRITTTMLLLAAIRDLIDDETVIKNINERYLTNTSCSSTESEFTVKLKQVETDWEVYKNIILSNPIAEDQLKSSVYKNYDFFIKQLNMLKDRGTNLVELIDHGLAFFVIISIQLEPDKNVSERPQEIFESMNSIGKPLSLADLVRNYLLMGLTDIEQERLYKNYWLPMEKALPQKLSDFIRDFMQMTFERSLNVASEKTTRVCIPNFDTHLKMQMQKIC